MACLDHHSGRRGRFHGGIGGLGLPVDLQQIAMCRWPPALRRGLRFAFCGRLRLFAQLDLGDHRGSVTAAGSRLVRPVHEQAPKDRSRPVRMARHALTFFRPTAAVMRSQVGREGTMTRAGVLTHLRHLTASHVAVAMQQVFASFPPRLHALHPSMNMALQILN